MNWITTFAGYDYELDANGKMIENDKIAGGYVNSIRYMLVRDGARIPDAQMKALLNLADGAEPTTRLEKDVAVNYGKDTPAAAKFCWRKRINPLRICSRVLRPKL